MTFGKKIVFCYVYSIIALCEPFSVFAQKNVKTIVDVQTRAPLDYVFIRSDDGRLKQMSTGEGKFVLLTDTRVKSFIFYKLGYIQRTLSTQELLANDTVLLAQKPFVLKEVVINNSKLSAVVKDKRYYVDDYLALENGDFIILTSRINVKGFEVCYFDPEKGITKTYKVKNEADGHFITDCFKNVHVVTNRFSRQVFFDSDSSFMFLPKYTRTSFDSALANCVLKMDTQLIVKYSPPPRRITIVDFDVEENPYFLMYQRFCKHGQQPFYRVSYNDRMLEMVRNELKDWSLMGLALNQPFKITPRIQNNILLFYKRIATPIYAPVFLKNDTVLIFNFQDEEIVFLNQAGRVLGRVKLDHEQFATLHGFEIIYDLPVQKFYIQLKESDRATINRINIYTGKIEQKVKLEKVFARNVQIVNDHIYYLVREKGWDDTQYLYSQN